MSQYLSCGLKWRYLPQVFNSVIISSSVIQCTMNDSTQSKKNHFLL